MLQLDVTIERAADLKHTGKHCVEIMLDGYDPVRTAWVEDEIDFSGNATREKKWGQAGRNLVINLRERPEDCDGKWLHIGVIHKRMIKTDKRAAEGSLPFSQLAKGFTGWVVLEHKSQFGGKLYLVVRLLSRQLVQPRPTSNVPRPHSNAPVTAASTAAPAEFEVTQADIEEQRAILASIELAKKADVRSSASHATVAKTSAAAAASWNLSAPPAPVPGRSRRQGHSNGGEASPAGFGTSPAAGEASPAGFGTSPAAALLSNQWGSASQGPQWTDWPGDASNNQGFGANETFGRDAFANDAFGGDAFARGGFFGAGFDNGHAQAGAESPGAMPLSEQSGMPAHGGVVAPNGGGCACSSSEMLLGDRKSTEQESCSSGASPSSSPLHEAAPTALEVSHVLPQDLPPWMEWRQFLAEFGDAAVESAPAANASGVAVTGPIDIPVSGVIVPPTGRRKAVVIGINYVTTPGQLSGSHADVDHMRETLLRVGFSEENLVCLRDGQADFAFLPTKRNILTALRWLAHGIVPGDVLFFHFSGHASQILDPKGTATSPVDDTICPVDLQWAGHISDHQLFECMVRHLPSGARLTAILDCCVPGPALNLPFVCDEHRGWIAEPDAYSTLGDVVCINLATTEDVSGDLLRDLCSRPGGVLTTAFLDALGVLSKSHGQPVTYLQLLEAMRGWLAGCSWQAGCGWQVRLSCSQAFDPTRRYFRFSDAVANGNATIGLQSQRAHKTPRAWCGPNGVDQALRFSPEIGPPPPYRGEPAAAGAVTAQGDSVGVASDEP